MMICLIFLYESVLGRALAGGGEIRGISPPVEENSLKMIEIFHKNDRSPPVIFFWLALVSGVDS